MDISGLLTAAHHQDWAACAINDFAADVAQDVRAQATAQGGASDDQLVAAGGERPATRPAGLTSVEGTLALRMQDSIRDVRKAMSELDRYTLVVRARGGRYHPRPWSWEICRDGEPLPARLRGDGFATEYTATAAGNVALRYFLAGLREEEGKT